MKPTWGIRKLNEYSVDKNTAIIITDSEKDNYYWADIPDGSLLVNDKTGNLSIKLTGESDWVPMGIRKDGTEKLVKDAIINVEYYTIVKFELEHNRFYYHDREEITRIGKLINGKAQFKVGSGLYLPGTNQLEVLINDSVHRNTVDGGLEEINMKYFQIDADDIRLGSTVTVRYINYERLSELYPFIYTQEQVPWFFEDKDLWINPADNVDVNGLTITPLSYYVKYLDNNEAEVIVFTTKNSRLIASRKMNEYVNKITDKNINRFKVTRENNNFYINLFSTYPGYKTSFAKILIKGLISDEDKLTLDVDLTYPNSGMAKTSIKTQLGNIVTIKRNNKKIYAAQNIGIGVQHTLAREDHDYDIIVSVKNPTNGLTKEKVLTIKKKMIRLTANIDHITTPSGTTVTVETIPGSKVKIVSIDQFGNQGTAIIPETAVDANGRFSGIIPLINSEAYYKVIITNEKADNTVEKNIEVLLHSPRTPLSVSRVDAYDGIDDNLKGCSGISVQAESGSTIVIKDQVGNVVFTHTPSNLSTEDTQYNVPLFYAPETKIFTIEANKTNKVPESKTITIQGYERIDAPVIFDVEDPIFEDIPFIGSVSYPHFKVQAGSTVIAYDENNNVVKTHGGKDSYIFAISLPNFNTSNAAYYEIRQKNSDKIIRFVCTHPLYKTVEVTKTFVGKHLSEYQFELLNTYVINSYADLYNSDAYQVLELKLYKTNENATRTSLTISGNPDITNSLILSYGDTNARLAKYTGTNLLEKIDGSKTSYLEFYGKDDLSNEETLTILPKINDYISNAYESNHNSYYFIFKVSNFNDILHDRSINIKVNGKATNDIIIPTTILHWKNLNKFIKDQKQKTVTDAYDELLKRNYKLYNSNKNISLYNIDIDKNIKYIHPIFYRFLCLRNSIGVDQQSLERFNKIKNEFKKFMFENITDDFLDFNNGYSIAGIPNIKENSVVVLNIAKDIKLYPSHFSCTFYKLNVNLNNIQYDDYKQYYPNIIFNFMSDTFKSNDKNKLEKNDFSDILINVSDHYNNNLRAYALIDFFANNSNLNISIRLNIGYDNGHSNNTSYNVGLIYNGKYIPSNFNNTYYKLGYSFLYLPNLEEADNNALCYSGGKIYINYSKLKRFHNFSFYHPFCQSIAYIYNLSEENIIYFNKIDNKNYENNIEPYYKQTKDVYNPEFNLLEKLNIMCPFPGSYGDPFKLYIYSNSENHDIGINSLLFSNQNIEEIKYIDVKSVTLLDENNKIWNKNEDSYSMSGIKKNVNLFFNKYGLPNNVLTNNSDIKLGTFSGLGKLKKLDLRIFTNLYLESYMFYNSLLDGELILPETYLILTNRNKNIINDEIFKSYKDQYVNKIQAIFYNLKANIITNINNYLEGTNVLEPDLLKSVNANLVLNLNYIGYIWDTPFDSYLKNNISFIHQKRLINRDHLGNLINFDGEIEMLEKNNNHLFFKTSTSVSLPLGLDQESFDLIKDRFILFPSYLLKNCQNIKEFIIKNNNIKYIFLDYATKFDKIVIESESLKTLSIVDNIFNDTEIKKDQNNYKIVAKNCLVFYAENKGIYSTYHTINIPNTKISFIANKNNLFYYYGNNYQLNLFSKHVIDYNGNSEGKDISYYNETESLSIINNNELTISVPMLHMLFDKNINKENINIEILNLDLNFSKNDYNILNLDLGYYIDNTSFSYRFSAIPYYLLFDYINNNVIEKIRWPKLKIINIHKIQGTIDPDPGKNYKEKNILGISIRYFNN